MRCGNGRENQRVYMQSWAEQPSQWRLCHCDINGLSVCQKQMQAIQKRMLLQRHWLWEVKALRDGLICSSAKIRTSVRSTETCTSADGNRGDGV